MTEPLHPAQGMQIIEAGPQHVASVRALFLEYQHSLDTNLCFQGFEQELATLPGRYASPRGAILLGIEHDNAIGCCTIRPQSDQVAELKRLYVQPGVRGKGYGRRLFERTMQAARVIGYARVVLDTLADMHAARKMYRDFGFTGADPHYDNPLPGIQYLQYEFE